MPSPRGRTGAMSGNDQRYQDGHSHSQSRNLSPSSSSPASMARTDSQTSPLSPSSSTYYHQPNDATSTSAPNIANTSHKFRRTLPSVDLWQQQSSTPQGPESPTSPLSTVPLLPSHDNDDLDQSLDRTRNIEVNQEPHQLSEQQRKIKQRNKDQHGSILPLSSSGSEASDAGDVASHGSYLDEGAPGASTVGSKDVGIGSYSSSTVDGRQSVGARSTRSLQGSPPRRASGSVSMATTLSHTPLRRYPSGDSGDEQSFFDAADEEDGAHDDNEVGSDDGEADGIGARTSREKGRSIRRSRLVPALSSVSDGQNALPSGQTVQRESSSVKWPGEPQPQAEGDDGISQRPSSSTLREDSVAPRTLPQAAALATNSCRAAVGLGSPLSVSSSVWLPGTPSEAPSTPPFLPSPDPSSATSALQSFGVSEDNVLSPARPLPDGPLPATPARKSLTEEPNASPASSMPDESSFTSSISGEASLSGTSRTEEHPPPIQSHQRRNSVASTLALPPPLLHSATSPIPAISSADPSAQVPTIRGRARGYTVGAVPASGRYPTFLGRYYNQKTPGPRSLLSRELTLPELEGPSPAPAALDEAREDEEDGKITASNSLPSDINLTTSHDTTLTSQTAAPSDTVDGVDRDRTDPLVASGSSSTQNLALPPLNSTSMPVGRSRSGSTASVLLQQVQHPPRSHASFVIAVIGHRGSGKTTVVKKGLKQFGLSKPHVLSEKVTSHSTLCVVNHEQRSIEVLEIDTSVLLTTKNATHDLPLDHSHINSVFAWPPYLPHIDAVILCYDAADKDSFRGMSNLLENFAITHLSIVMLACKSDLHPKRVDPYFASDLAGVYGVGLAECTVLSEEGKKRMRDCFSYLVKEVAKARAARVRKSRAPTSGSASVGSTTVVDASGESSPNSPASIARSARGDGTQSSRALSRSPQRSASDAEELTTAGLRDSPPASGWDSAASSSSRDRRMSVAGHVGRLPRRPSSAYGGGPSGNGNDSSRVASDNSDTPSGIGEHSEEDGLGHRGTAKLPLSQQHARSVGGYVPIEELWDKLFFAAVSGNDPRFVLMFMVFYRGFVRPAKLLSELVVRFEKLASLEQQDKSIVRFAMLQLTKLLGDWVQDYPGDLSGPDTYPLLCSFFQRLCEHPATTHTASLLQAYVDDVRDAPDLDAAWSRDQDSSRPKAIAADASPFRQTMAPERPDFPATMLRGNSRERSDSDVSEARSNSSNRCDGAMPASQLASLINNDANRPRSASDVTSFSGVNGDGGSPQGYTSSSSINIANPCGVDSLRSNDGTLPFGMDAHQQKSSLRSISQSLEAAEDVAIAAELTRLEWELFIAISPRDLLRHILVPRIVRGNDGPVAKSIIHFNYISFWVCSMILVQQKVKNRARMLEKFMNIASILRHSNNYNTLQAILAGLNNASIHRLRSTREALTSKTVSKVYQSLNRLMGSDRSFAAYRLALENSEGKTIPYLGVHLQDILSMSDGNPSKRASDDTVHWRKFSLMDEAVMAIVRCQREDGAGKPNTSIERLIMNVPVMDEDALYQRSLTVEPRQGAGSTTAGSKILKMLNNS